VHKPSPVFQWNINEHNYSQSKVRIYCLIITAPQHLNTRARAIHSTWGSRCDGHSFVTEYSNNTKGLPIASIANITPGYEHLTQKSVLAFLYAYKKFRNDYDWFVKADDDTYLFIENLKYFLRDKNPSHPVTYGQNFKVGT
jgi:glycoprotein-N-acetylgalactosamine 3-beta-galactosyltransferase